MYLAPILSSQCRNCKTILQFMFRYYHSSTESNKVLIFNDRKCDSFERVISTVNHLLSLSKYLIEHSGKAEKSLEDGRIGNIKVSFDTLGLSSRILSSDSFKIIGVSHFGTIKTNCGVYRGMLNKYDAVIKSCRSKCLLHFILTER